MLRTCSNRSNTRRQERVNRVEADARDEERLKNSKAEDDARAMVNLVGGDVLAKPRVVG